MLRYTGTGRDTLNAFTLEGLLNTKTGVITMIKTYFDNAGPTWNNIGLLTPLGIFTCWGREEWGGWALIWKTSWCPEDGEGAVNGNGQQEES